MRGVGGGGGGAPPPTTPTSLEAEQRASDAQPVSPGRIHEHFHGRSGGRPSDRSDVAIFGRLEFNTDDRSEFGRQTKQG